MTWRAPSTTHPFASSSLRADGRRELAIIAIIVVLGIAAASLLLSARVKLQDLTNSLQRYSASTLTLSRSVNFLMINRDEANTPIQKYLKVRIKEGLDDVEAQKRDVDQDIAQLNTPLMRWLVAVSKRSILSLGNDADTSELRRLAQKLVDSDEATERTVTSIGTELAVAIKSGEYLDHVRERAARAVTLSQQGTQPLLLLLLCIGSTVLLGIFVVWQRALMPLIDRLQVSDMESRAAQRVARFGYWIYGANMAFHASDGLAEVLRMAPSDAPQSLEQIARVGHQSSATATTVLDAYKTLTENDGAREFTRILATDGGNERVIRERVESYLDPVTGARHVIGFMIDVSELAKAQAQAARTDKLESIGMLTGAIAHDVNNVLAVVQGNVDLIGIDPSRPETGARIAAIKRATASATTLLAQISTISIGGGIDREVFEPALAADDAIKLFTADAANSCLLTVDFEDGLQGTLTTNRSQYVNALLNLLINAKEAVGAHRDGKIRLSMCRVDNPPLADHGTAIMPGTFVRIDVADNGVGMSDEVLRRAADPFYSTKLATASQKRGLGLWSAYMFARNANGHLSISSRAEAGTRVTMHLPLALKSRDRTAPAVAQPAPANSRSGASVLLVDDKTDLLAALEAQLRHCGYEVTTANGIRGALEALSSSPNVDVIVSDLKLAGGGNGLHSRAKNSQPLSDEKGRVHIRILRPSRRRSAAAGNPLDPQTNRHPGLGCRNPAPLS